MTKAAMLSDLKCYLGIDTSYSLRDTLVLYLNKEAAEMPFKDYIRLYRLANGSDNQRLLALNIIYRRILNESN